MPELPAQKRVRFAEEFSLDAATIETLLNWKELNEYFEQTVSEIDAWIETDGSGDRSKLIKAAANWCLQDFSALLNADLANPLESKVSAENMAELVKLIDAGKISSSAAKQVFKKM